MANSVFSGLPPILRPSGAIIHSLLESAGCGPQDRARDQRGAHHGVNRALRRLTKSKIILTKALPKPRLGGRLATDVFEVQLSAGERGAGVEAIFSRRARRQCGPDPIEVCTARPCPRPRTKRANERPNDGQRLRVGTLSCFSARGPLVVMRARPIEATKRRNAGPVHSRRVRGV